MTSKRFLLGSQKRYIILKLNHNSAVQQFCFSRRKTNYSTKTGNANIFGDLDYWPRNPFIKFTLKHCLFGVTKIVKNDDRITYIYSGYGVGRI